MSNKLQSELYRVAATTFEQLCFMFITPELEEEQRNAPSDAAASVDFSGPFKGRLVVKVCGNLLPEIAANMLGQEGRVSEQQQCDALGEIANIICGNVLPGIAHSEEVFHVSAPRMVEPESFNGDSKSPTAEAHVGLEGGRADLLLFIDRDGHE